MKNVCLLLVILLISCCRTEFLHGAEQIYPLKISMNVYPKEIRYGDICFVTFQVTNQGEKTLCLPYGGTFRLTTSIALSQNEVPLFIWSRGHFKHNEGVYAETLTDYTYSSCTVAPGETVEFSFRPIWIPMPEFTHRDDAKKIQKYAKSRNKTFTLSAKIDYRSAFRAMSWYRDANGKVWERRFNRGEGLDFDGLRGEGYGLQESNYVCEYPLRIDSRPWNRGNEVKLIQEWYLELPEAQDGDWSMQHVFAHPFHVRGSPYKMNAKTPEELEKKRRPFYETYLKFDKSMQTPTPEVLKRIQRTKELEAKILKLAASPNSTISTNMAEFVRLRGFLVDIRYAENETEETKAFEKMCDWLDTTKDKKLWLKFLDEIGFDSLGNYDHFPRNKVDQYRDLLKKRFEKSTMK